MRTIDIDAAAKDVDHTIGALKKDSWSRWRGSNK